MSTHDAHFTSQHPDLNPAAYPDGWCPGGCTISLDRQYAYLQNPQEETNTRLMAVIDLRCAMNQRRGEILGVTRMSSSLAGLAHRLDQGDLDGAIAYLEGMVRGAADTVDRLVRETASLGLQVEHIGGVR